MASTQCSYWAIITIFNFINYGPYLYFIWVFLLGAIIVYFFFSLINVEIYLVWNLWIRGSAPVELTFLLDNVSILFLFTVILISIRVLFFSFSYMARDPYFSRFHLLVCRFIISMILLILSPNLVTALLGWDGLGITSYLLVIYYGSRKAYNAGIITALSNRVGDAFLLVAIAMLASSIDWNFIWYRNTGRRIYLTFLIMAAAFTKRAQVPFSAWLPAAMAAPTPVSSLVHSSTLVTAGVYLILRHSPGYFYSVSSIIVIVGCLTILLARVGAFAEADIKKIVALSTLSQLGIIITAIGLGRHDLAFAHLIIHAFFKAILFIATGNIIHSSRDYQALLKTGRAIGAIPVSSARLVAGTLRLCGLPFIAAFYSKEPIIEYSLLNNFNALVSLFLIFGVGATILYSIRFLIKVLHIYRNSSNLNWKAEGDRNSETGLLLLIIPSFIRGSLMSIRVFWSPKFIHYRAGIKVLNYLILITGLLFRLKLVLTSRGLFWGIHNLSAMWALPKFSAQIIRRAGLHIRWNERLLDGQWLWFTESEIFWFGGRGQYFASSVYIIKIIFRLILGGALFYAW